LSHHFAVSRSTTITCLTIQLFGAIVVNAQTSPRSQEVPAPNAQSTGTSNPTGAAVKAFLDRVDAYIDLQKKVASGLPKLKDDAWPDDIEAHQAAMAARIRLARPKAKRGEIFGDAEPIFKAVVDGDKVLRGLRDRRAAMEEVPRFDPPSINAAYPEKLPLATVPPLILDQFPRLPDGHLEYRFMGNDLIIRDVMANLIADFINNAVPAAVR
jgi:hypothetical protein